MYEFDFIEKYLVPITLGEPAALGLKDDAALLTVAPGHSLVTTMDALVAGVHFFADDHPADIARKMLRVNLSDLAAMGATPTAYTLALMLPKNIQESWIAAFCKALKEDSYRFHIPLIGGDTVSHEGALSVALTLFGEVPQGSALRRSVARPGDKIYVSGTIGDSALGLKLLKGEIKGLSPQAESFLIGRYHQPQPRVGLGKELVSRTLSYAAIDISDGLVQDAGHICKASGIGMKIYASQIPLSEAASEAVKKYPELWGTILTGGDDYELLFTIPTKNYAPNHALSCPVAEIGTVVEREGVVVVDTQEKPMTFASPGYKHMVTEKA